MKAIDRMIQHPTLNPVANKISEGGAHLKKHGSYLGVQPNGGHVGIMTTPKVLKSLYMLTI